jgi:CBS domain-containing protein
MKCPSCGYVNLPGADVCENCETSLTQDDVPQAETEVERSLMEDPVECLEPIKPLTVDSLTSLTEAIELMCNHHIGCVLVSAADGSGSLAGILTERDLLQKVAGHGLDLDQCAVQDFMTEVPETSRTDHSLGYAIQRMIVSDLRYLPLVNETGRPVGIVSSRDIIKYIATNCIFDNRLPRSTPAPSIQKQPKGRHQ